MWPDLSDWGHFTKIIKYASNLVQYKKGTCVWFEKQEKENKVCDVETVIKN